MTKICGIVKTKEYPHLVSLIKSMTLSMKHQPWHKTHYFSDGSIGLGHLSVQAINMESQPIWNENKTKCIIMAGKIFDYEKQKKELVKKGYNFRYEDNDAEYILYSFEEYGTKFIRNLNGIFTFAIWDKQDNRLTLVNDRYGFRPLYYYKNKDKLVFASEVKSIIQDKSIKRKINWKAWTDFFAFEWVAGDDTFFKNIYAMPNASILIFKKGKSSIKKYWDYSEIKIDYKHSEEYFLEQTEKLINNAMIKLVGSLNGQRIIVPLSGGNDSRTIACTLARNNVKFRAISTTQLTPKADLDLDFSKRVSQHIGIDRKVVKLNEYIYKNFFIKTFLLTDGMAPCHIWSNPLITSLPKASIVFDGIAGDVLIGRDLFMSEKDQQMSKSFKGNKLAKLFFRNMGGGKKILIAKLLRKRALSQLHTEKSIKSIETNLSKIRDSPNKATEFFIKNRTRRAICAYSFNMLNSISETFCPFTENELVEFVLSIPPEITICYKFYNKLVKKMFPSISKIPTTRAKPLKINWEKYRFDTKSMRKKKIDYYLNLFKRYEPPKQFFNHNLISNKIESYLRIEEDPTWFLEPYLYFTVWYNDFFKMN